MMVGANTVYDMVVVVGMGVVMVEVVVMVQG